MASPQGLQNITLPQTSAQKAQILLEEEIKDAEWSPGHFHELLGRFQLYFSGIKVTFPDKLFFSSATPFQRSVWEATKLIPYGETRSYGWVAQEIDSPKSARAVGQALGKNPIPIIVPCHRVIAGDGGIGGFGGGPKMKRQFLALENVTINR
ncbi:methylated-DNA--[protein]-cysteine S-methyltransferase [Chloroflexota bacterium]